MPDNETSLLQAPKTKTGIQLHSIRRLLFSRIYEPFDRLQSPCKILFHDVRLMKDHSLFPWTIPALFSPVLRNRVASYWLPIVFLIYRFNCWYRWQTNDYNEIYETNGRMNEIQSNRIFFSTLLDNSGRLWLIFLLFLAFQRNLQNFLIL